ncbi:MAG: DUF4325 domain-containing protein, partial [Deltaproteobacteria bacterium]|nr:DUF4325 domain-containing protein [Deltaproteobacteria bacterium]
MKIELKKFGNILVSRPDGREAALAMKAYSKPISEFIELDFTGVDILTPSWLDEFIQTLKQNLPSLQVKFLPSKNPSVIESIKVLEE